MQEIVYDTLKKVASFSYFGTKILSCEQNSRENYRENLWSQKKYFTL